MSNKFGSIKERVLQLADFYKVGRKKFCENIGQTYGNFTGKAKNTPLNSSVIGNILSIYPSINANWLITGEGDMVIKSHKQPPELSDKAIDYIMEDSIIILELNKRIKVMEDMIELLKDENKRLKAVVSDKFQ